MLFGSVRFRMLKFLKFTNWPVSFQIAFLASPSANTTTQSFYLNPSIYFLELAVTGLG